jgi:hypothetical protein
MKKKATSRRGGKRPGAGRKPGKTPPKKRVTFSLAADVVKWLDQQPKGTKAGAVEAAIRARRALEVSR